MLLIVLGFHARRKLLHRRIRLVRIDFDGFAKQGMDHRLIRGVPLGKRTRRQDWKGGRERYRAKEDAVKVFRGFWYTNLIRSDSLKVSPLTQVFHR